MDFNPPLEPSRAALDECGVSRAASSESEIDRIYLENAAFLRRIAIRKFRVPPAEAEALVHDVFINYLIRARHVRGEVRGYLVAGICNASRNYWRSQKLETRLFSDDDLAAIDARGEDLLDGLVLNLVVASILSRLGARCREVLKRYYLDGDDSATIALAMETSPANVNYMMHVCRKRAREAYETMTRVP